MANEILEVKDLALCTDEGVRLCSDISFTLHEGEYMCVVGAGGCGKSLMTDVILGLRKPLSGSVTYMNGLTRADIGCMPQSLDLMGNSTVMEVVLAGCLVGMKKLFIGHRERERAMSSLKRLNVDELSKRRFGELSGGQKQRVLLARALCSAKKLLILDDPMHGLDIVAKDEFYSEIIKIYRDDGIAVMMIDHDALDGTVLHLSDTMLYCGPVENYVDSVAGKFYFAGRII